jgi:four helix bundle protein
LVVFIASIPLGGAMGDFNRLVAWQKSRSFTQQLNVAFKAGSTTVPGLRGQILRAAGSVSSTLAEGCAKDSRAELARFANMAYGSIKEVESDLIRAYDAGLLTLAEFEDLARQADDVARWCYGLAHPRRHRRRPAPPPHPTNKTPPPTDSTPHPTSDN